MSAKTTADKLWSEVVRGRDGRCRRCRTAGQRNARGLYVVGLEAAHIIRRGYGHTRTDERNGLALCSLCAKHFTEDPPAWEPFVVSQIGEGLLAELRVKSRNLAHVDWDAEVSRLASIHSRLVAAA